MAVSRHLGFYRTANSAIRSADPENPSLEPNMEWIGCTVCEIFAFKLYCDLETGVRGHSRSSKTALFVFHSNYASISYRFRDIAAYWSKIATPLYLEPPLKLMKLIVVTAIDQFLQSGANSHRAYRTASHKMILLLLVCAGLECILERLCCTLLACYSGQRKTTD